MKRQLVIGIILLFCITGFVNGASATAEETTSARSTTITLEPTQEHQTYDEKTKYEFTIVANNADSEVGSYYIKINSSNHQLLTLESFESASGGYMNHSEFNSENSTLIIANIGRFPSSNGDVELGTVTVKSHSEGNVSLSSKVEVLTDYSGTDFATDVEATQIQIKDSNSELSGIPEKYDRNPTDGEINIVELGAAATDYANNNIGITELGAVATEYAS